MQVDSATLKKIKGDFSFRPSPPRPGDEVFVMPFKRSVFGILMAFIFVVAFSQPYWSMGDMMGGDEDDLFSLVFTMFSLFFLLGWSVGFFLLLSMFLAMLVGQERVTIGTGRITIRLEVFGIGLEKQFDGDKITHLKRFEPPDTGSTSWRGPHLIFQYEGDTMEFGSNLSERVTEGLIGELEKRVVGIKPTQFHKAAPPAEKATRKRPQPSQADITIESSSVVALMAANVVPVIGVIFFGWSVGHIMLLYWAESAIIGAFNIAKMWKIEPTATLFMGPFFLGHYGGFMVGHLLFIYGLVLAGPNGDTSLTAVSQDFVMLLPAFIALTISHGVSFVTNFLGREEYLDVKISQQMMAPYKRITIMHVTLIIGGFLAMALSSPLPVLLLMIGLKTVMDARAHMKERKRLTSNES